MDPIETLMAEHRQIELVLGALENYAGLLRSNAAADRADLGRFATFLREYADALHHGKEEDLLFAKMAEAGFPREGGPLFVMLTEHDQGRRLVGAMREVASHEGPFTAAERQSAANAALEFASLLRAHIGKEDRVLYPMAEAHVSAEVMQALGTTFLRLDGERAAAFERLNAIADDLVARYSDGRRPRTASSSEDSEGPGGGCCGCH